MRRKIIFVSFIAIVTVMMLVNYYKGYLSEEQTLHRIINEQGYTLHVQDRGISFELPIREEWIPDQEGERVTNFKIKVQHDTVILLRRVILRGNCLIFNFEAKTNTAKNRKSGEFLYLDEKLGNGSIVSYGPLDEWMFLDINGADLMYGSKEIDGYGAGEGPGNQFNVSLDDKHNKLIKEGLIIKFSGFVLYKYSKR